MHNFVDPQPDGCVITETRKMRRTEVDEASNGSASNNTIINEQLIHTPSVLNNYYCTGGKFRGWKISCNSRFCLI